MTKTHRMKADPEWSSPTHPLYIPGPPTAPGTDTHAAAQRERDRLLDEFGIRREGCQFVHDGRFYERLDDAVRRAWLGHGSNTPEPLSN